MSINSDRGERYRSCISYRDSDIASVLSSSDEDEYTNESNSSNVLEPSEQGNDDDSKHNSLNSTNLRPRPFSREFPSPPSSPNSSGINRPLLGQDTVSDIEEAKSLADVWPIPDQRFLVRMPDWFESFFFRFDSSITRVLQHKRSKWIGILGILFTSIFAIEIGFALPFVLFVSGWDALATELTYLMLFLGLLSQIPKRFLWRHRPYMVNRAYKMRGDKEGAKTSSFPSRAVTCATVYSFFLCYVYNHLYNKDVNYSSDLFIQWWMPIFVGACVLLSSWSRISLGVHYPSDCIFGFLQGCVVSVVATVLHNLHKTGAYWCSSCFESTTSNCYADAAHAIRLSDFIRVNWVVFGCCTIVSILIVGFSVMKPINFWSKMLLPCVTFQMTFLCKELSQRPGRGGFSLPKPSHPWWSWFFGLGVVGVSAFFVYKNKGRYSMLSFLLVYFVLYFSMGVWRSWDEMIE
ncbi:hypothetical protein PROFUN_12197 [Planoprotostelium fungivorum]|uniref:Phosphatidic acid phosphatase type 2/haloperoxidase domain-containing protein n=1 Tax=Planoprotostelium fungivorum TaxID=1890364 RepID=A0A2P6N8I0_9EUKA|nr:hypothetical protein PROFUN_12197 [Planoprotostelium fungivorum]